MKFLSLIRINENSGKVPCERLMTDMGKLIDEMTRTGVLRDTAGLRPTSEAVRVRLSRGKLSTVDGPFVETKESDRRYAILETQSRKEAVDLTKRFLAIHGDEWEIECEVRQLEEPDLAGARSSAA